MGKGEAGKSAHDLLKDDKVSRKVTLSRTLIVSSEFLHLEMELEFIVKASRKLYHDLM